MEGRTEPRAGAARPRRGSRTPLLGAALVLVLAGGYALTRVQRDDAPSAPIAPATALTTPSTAAPSASAPASAPVAPAPAAVIVDAAPAVGKTPFSDFEPPPVRGATTTGTVPTPSPAGRAPAAARAAATKPAPPARREQATATKAASPRDDDLIAGLLKNIEQRAPDSRRTSAARSPMDDLVQQIESQNNQARNGPASGPRDVQAQLRKCPKPNTSRGIACRQKVCARFAGRDPACPAPQ